MLNQTVIVGRIVKEPEVKELDDGKKVSNMSIAVPRNYKNEEGEYETDFINCVLWNGIASNVAEYCQKGDLVGVKGRLQTSNYEKDGQKHYVQELVAEKVTFLSTKKSREDEVEHEAKEEKKSVTKSKKQDKELD